MKPMFGDKEIKTVTIDLEHNNAYFYAEVRTPTSFGGTTNGLVMVCSFHIIQEATIYKALVVFVSDAMAIYKDEHS